MKDLVRYLCERTLLAAIAFSMHGDASAKKPPVDADPGGKTGRFSEACTVIFEDDRYLIRDDGERHEFSSYDGDKLVTAECDAGKGKVVKTELR